MHQPESEAFGTMEGTYQVGLSVGHHQQEIAAAEEPFSAWVRGCMREGELYVLGCCGIGVLGIYSGVFAKETLRLRVGDLGQ